MDLQRVRQNITIDSMIISHDGYYALKGKYDIVGTTELVVRNDFTVKYLGPFQ